MVLFISVDCCVLMFVTGPFPCKAITSVNWKSGKGCATYFYAFLHFRNEYNVNVLDTNDRNLFMTEG